MSHSLDSESSPRRALAVSLGLKTSPLLLSHTHLAEVGVGGAAPRARRLVKSRREPPIPALEEGVAEVRVRVPPQPPQHRYHAAVCSGGGLGLCISSSVASSVRTSHTAKCAFLASEEAATTLKTSSAYVRDWGLMGRWLPRQPQSRWRMGGGLLTPQTLGPLAWHWSHWPGIFVNEGRGSCICSKGSNPVDHACSGDFVGLGLEGEVGAAPAAAAPLSRWMVRG